MRQLDVLNQRLRLAADYLKEYGWVQDTERDDSGRVCMTGAIRHCVPQTGDEYLIREVLRARDRAESWNDRDDRTADEVLDVLRTATISDTDLEAVFGPQWREIATLTRQAAALTPDQEEGLRVEWNRRLKAADSHPGLKHSQGTAEFSSRRVFVRRSLHAVQDSTWVSAKYFAEDAARGLAARGEISEEVFDQLYGPWASVFGPPAPCEL